MNTAIIYIFVGRDSLLNCKDALPPLTLTCNNMLRRGSKWLEMSPTPTHHQPTPFHFKKEKKPLLPQLGWRRGHRWKSIKRLELSGMEKVSAMIWTQPGLITTLIHSHFGRVGGDRGERGWWVGRSEVVRLPSAAQQLGRHFCGFSLTGGRRLKE